MPPVFVHLHVHSDYSLSQGASKPAAYVERAKKLGMPALALVDAGAMYGAMEFSEKAAKAGVQPIVGCQIQLKDGHVVLLAKDARGYVNLTTLLVEASAPREVDGRRMGGDAPVADLALLARHAEGLILLTGADGGLVPSLLRQGKTAEARTALVLLREAFGDRLYLQVARDGNPTEADLAAERALLDLAADVRAFPGGPMGGGLPLVAAPEVFHAEEGDALTYALLRAISTKGSIDVSAGEPPGGRHHMASPEEIAALYADLPEAIENAAAIAGRCAFLAQGRKPILPPFPTAQGRSEADELAAQAEAGLARRLEGRPAEARAPYEERLRYELGVIAAMGFPGYFLIVADFIRWAKERDIPVGPGRGSGAGSVAAWALDVTDLDPLRFGLLFERFLNPERVSMPDFDVDFCETRRDEVIRYVQERYGDERVARIVTFGEIKAKTALKDAGRVTTHDKFGGYGHGELNDITKLFDSMVNGENVDLARALEGWPEFAQRMASSEKYRILLDNARRIEGLYRQAGAHAAGIVIGDRPLHELVPVGWDANAGMRVTQFNMKWAEKAGLVKFDFLGLKTLSVIKLAVDLVRRRGLALDLRAIPLDDAPTFEMLARGDANGVFQLESDGMKKALRQIRPDRIEDLIAVVALYRPGPMDQIPLYAACKNGLERPVYPQPADRTAPVLEETFGIMVYQEQVMKVAQEVAGYSLGGADLLRRAMGKKIKAEMDAQRDVFVKGATGRGVPRKDAEALFDHIDKFAGYGFNKSHAAAYALIAYQTAWLKRHHPVEFFAALLTYETAKPERMAAIKDDMDALDIPLLPPSVAASEAGFAPEARTAGGAPDAVRMGLTAVNGVSAAPSAAMVEERRRGGPFRDLADWTRRCGATFNKAQIEKLASVGAFDGMARNRRAAASTIAWLSKHDKPGGQADLFAGTAGAKPPPSVAEVAEWGDVADREFNAAGFYFNLHPIDPYLPRLKRIGVKRLASVLDWMGKNRKDVVTDLKLCVLVEKVIKTETRAGKPYLKAFVGERRDQYLVLFFGGGGQSLDDLRAELESAKTSRSPVVVDCDVKNEEKGPSVWGRRARAVDAVSVGGGGQWHVRLAGAAAVAPLSAALKAAAVEGEAGSLVTVFVEDGGRERVFNVPQRVRFDPALEMAIKGIDGVLSLREAA